MKKFFAILILFGLLNIISTTYASLPTPTQAIRENLLEDAVLDLLTKPIYSAIDDYYGTTYNIAAHCQRVIDIKKLRHPGSWYFEVEIEFVTYTGAHNYMDIFIVTLKKDRETEGKWITQKYDVRKYDQKEKYECRSPA
ncbi:DUF3888 domain-containing protein [Sutcliffiella horikoshii]|uniref:DUF3888 domain-containing protein n=1 Tax=Sutcliffiella horikoshii TaxID=79883 RepID=UPI003CEBC6FB